MAMPGDPQPLHPEASATEATRSPAYPGSAARSPRMVSSETLLAGATQLAIVHNETVYYLRQTRLGKLILTK